MYLCQFFLNLSRSSLQLWRSLPLALVQPLGVHLVTFFAQRLSFDLINFPAYLHFRLPISSKASMTFVFCLISFAWTWCIRVIPNIIRSCARCMRYMYSYIYNYIYTSIGQNRSKLSSRYPMFFGEWWMLDTFLRSIRIHWHFWMQEATSSSKKSNRRYSILKNTIVSGSDRQAQYIFRQIGACGHLLDVILKTTASP